MDAETLVLLRNMLSGVTLQVGADDFAATAAAAVKALTQLDAAITDLTPTNKDPS